MILFPIVTSLISITFALILIYFIKQYPTGSGKQIEIWEAIKEGSRAYLKRQNLTVGIVALAIAVILWFIPVFGSRIALGFLVGAFA